MPRSPLTSTAFALLHLGALGLCMLAVSGLTLTAVCLIRYLH